MVSSIKEVFERRIHKGGSEGKGGQGVVEVVSSRLFCPLRSSRKRDDSRLGRTHIVRGLSILHVIVIRLVRCAHHFLDVIVLELKLHLCRLNILWQPCDDALLIGAFAVGLDDHTVAVFILSRRWVLRGVLKKGSYQID